MSTFTQIYEEYAQPLFRFLFALTGDEDLAEELQQETFYQAFLHIDRFEGRCSLYTWLCQIGKNAWLKECRRKRRFESMEDTDLPPDRRTPETRVIDRDRLARVRQAVYRLEEPYKEVFILHTFGGLKLKDIAQSFGKSESWARVTYYRAKSKIAQEVSE